MCKDVHSSMSKVASLRGQCPKNRVFILDFVGHFPDPCFKD